MVYLDTLSWNLLNCWWQGSSLVSRRLRKTTDLPLSCKSLLTDVWLPWPRGQSYHVWKSWLSWCFIAKLFSLAFGGWLWHHHTNYHAVATTLLTSHFHRHRTAGESISRCLSTSPSLLKYYFRRDLSISSPAECSWGAYLMSCPWQRRDAPTAFIYVFIAATCSPWWILSVWHLFYPPFSSSSPSLKLLAGDK